MEFSDMKILANAGSGLRPGPEDSRKENKVADSKVPAPNIMEAIPKPSQPPKEPTMMSKPQENTRNESYFKDNQRNPEMISALPPKPSERSTTDTPSKPSEKTGLTKAPSQQDRRANEDEMRRGARTSQSSDFIERPQSTTDRKSSLENRATTPSQDRPRPASRTDVNGGRSRKNSIKENGVRGGLLAP